MEPIVMISSILLWIVVLFNLLLTVALIRRGVAKPPGLDMENMPTLEIGSQAPDFTAETLDGETVTLADYAGKSIALIFVSPACKPCLEKLPTLNALHKKQEKADVELILISAADRLETQQMVKSHKLIVPILIASRDNNTFFMDYMANHTPFYCLIDKCGMIQASGIFNHGWENLYSNWMNFEEAQP